MAPQGASGFTRLRELVRLLGGLIGDVAREQEGEGRFRAIETLRRGFIALRETADPVLRDRLEGLIGELSAADAAVVIRAFSAFFALVNIAEEVVRGIAYFTLRYGPWSITRARRLEKLRNLAAEAAASAENRLDWAEHYGHKPAETEEPSGQVAP